MQADDITVEVRNKALTRLGTIRGSDLLGVFRPALNAAGGWELTLRADHEMARHLRRPGSGIIVSVDGTVVLSGPTTEPKTTYGIGDVSGTCTFTGTTDTVHLDDRLAYTDPSTGYQSIADAQEDVRTGRPDDVMMGFVLANMGGNSPASRRIEGLTAASTSTKAMGTITKAGRLQNMGELLTEIANPHSLAYDIVQLDDHLVFRVWDIRDRTNYVRLDVANGMLTSAEIMRTPPEVTHVIVAGKGEITNRRILEASTAASVAAGATWGRRIERLIDDPNTEDEGKLRESAATDLRNGGKSEVVSKAVPVEDSSLRFMTNWRVGDLVSLTLDDDVETSLITGAVIMADASGVRIGAQIGEVRRFNRTAADGMARLKSNMTRIAESAYGRGVPSGGGSGGVSLEYAYIVDENIYTESGLVLATPDGYDLDTAKKMAEKAREKEEAAAKEEGREPDPDVWAVDNGVRKLKFLRNYTPAPGDYVIHIGDVILGRAIGGPYDSGQWSEPIPPLGRMPDADPSRWGELTVTKTTTGWVIVTGCLKIEGRLVETSDGYSYRHLFTLPGEMRPTSPDARFIWGQSNAGYLQVASNGEVRGYGYQEDDTLIPIALAYNNNRDGLKGDSSGAIGADAYGMVFGTGNTTFDYQYPGLGYTGLRASKTFTDFLYVDRYTRGYNGWQTGSISSQGDEHHGISGGHLEEMRYAGPGHTMEFTELDTTNGWQRDAMVFDYWGLPTSAEDYPRVALRKDGLAVLAGGVNSGLIGKAACIIPEGMRPKYETVFIWGRITPAGEVIPDSSSFSGGHGVPFMHSMWVADH